MRFPVAIAIALLPYAFTPVADAAPKPYLIPTVVLQGCAEKVSAVHSNWLAGGLIGRAGGNAQGAQTRGFDLSFVNTSAKIANLVLHRVGRTDPFATSVESAWIERVSEIARRRLPPLTSVAIDREACLAGLCEQSPDGHAILGAAAEVPNRYYVNGPPVTAPCMLTHSGCCLPN